MLVSYLISICSSFRSPAGPEVHPAGCPRNTERGTDTARNLAMLRVSKGRLVCKDPDVLFAALREVKTPEVFKKLNTFQTEIKLSAWSIR